jgi:hypothetical protein
MKLEEKIEQIIEKFPEIGEKTKSHSGFSYAIMATYSSDVTDIDFKENDKYKIAAICRIRDGARVAGDCDTHTAGSIELYFKEKGKEGLKCIETCPQFSYTDAYVNVYGEKMLFETGYPPEYVKIIDIKDNDVNVVWAYDEEHKKKTVYKFNLIWEQAERMRM